ncbi:MAG: NAD(P)H-hydrate dehydratase [Nitrospirales bacterium]
MARLKRNLTHVLEQPYIPLVTAAQMQILDQRTINEAKIPGLTLMERAGKGVVQTLKQQCGSPSGKFIVVFCGKGNNGGDGLVIARLLTQLRANVHIILLAKPKELTKDALSMYRRVRKISRPAIIHQEPSEKTIRTVTARGEILVDALLGTGLSTPVKGPYRTAINLMNASQVPIIAVDLPSGIHGDTGLTLGVAVKAQSTVTFGCPKIGLFLGNAIDHAGIITTVDIGIPQQYVEEIQSPVHLLTPESIAHLLPARNLSSHKGTYGHVGVIAGSPGKTGSATLTARATLRTGAGLVTVATPQSAQASMDAKLLEAMTHAMPETKSQTLGRAALIPLINFAKERDAIALGPGLGTHADTGIVIRQLLPRLQEPCVIDADGLNVLAGHLRVLSSCTRMPILTPHPGEMARLLNKASAEVINANRLGFALQLATRYKVIVVLKGARTLIAAPDGQTAICATGNPGMASAGMGDALTGVIVSLLAQGLSPWDAARAGVCLHGLAGDLAAETLGEASMIASDLIEHLPHAFQEILSHR